MVFYVVDAHKAVRGPFDERAVAEREMIMAERKYDSNFAIEERQEEDHG